MNIMRSGPQPSAKGPRQSSRQHCGYRASKNRATRNVDGLRHFCAKTSLAMATALTAFGHPA